MLAFPQKSHRFNFTIPPPSVELAEFCGIMLGDGGIAPYQVAITLHTDEHDYAIYITNLIEHLFGIRPNRYRKKRSQAVDIVISRIGVADFLTTTGGLKRGNKVAQQVDIPRWIKEDDAFAIACMRGLFDTDGSVFTHRYLSNGKQYSYKKLSFTSASVPLLISAQNILKCSGTRSRYGSRHDLRIESTADVARYFRVFGTNNPKHLKRYQSKVG